MALNLQHNALNFAKIGQGNISTFLTQIYLKIFNIFSWISMKVDKIGKSKAFNRIITICGALHVKSPSISCNLF